MSGYNTLWVPGTDHAGIATQARTVAMCCVVLLQPSGVGCCARLLWVLLACSRPDKHSQLPAFSHLCSCLALVFLCPMQTVVEKKIAREKGLTRHDLGEPAGVG